MVGASNIKADGIDDLVIGAPVAISGEQNAMGECYVVFGGAATRSR